MASRPCGTLESYNSLLDPHLAAYFSGTKVRKHLKKSGLVTKNGLLRSQTEIDEFNKRYESKKQLNDLLATAIVMKASELDRHKTFEHKKQIVEMEKRQRVLDAKARKQRPAYTKSVSAKFYKEVEVEDYEEASIEEGESPNSTINSKNKYDAYDNVKITLPKAVQKPDFDQIYSMTKLLERKVISPYITNNGNKKREGDFPTLVHDRVQAKIYGARPKSKSFVPKPQPKKTVKIKDINRLARSKLPNIRKLEEEKTKQKKIKREKRKAEQQKNGNIGDFSSTSESEKSLNKEKEKSDETEKMESITYRKSGVYYPNEYNVNAKRNSNLDHESKSHSKTSSRPSSSKKSTSQKSENFRQKIQSPEPANDSDSSIYEKKNSVVSEPPKSILKNSSSNVPSIRNSTKEDDDQQVKLSRKNTLENNDSSFSSDSGKQSTPREGSENASITKASKVELPMNGKLLGVVSRSTSSDKQELKSVSVSSSISSVKDQGSDSSMLTDSSLDDEKSKKSSSFFAVAS